MTRLLFLINGDRSSAAALRAAAFSEALGPDFEITMRYREGGKVLSIVRFFWEAVRLRPDVVYVVHGEPAASAELARRIGAELGWLAVVARDGERVRVR